jgi:hydroxymethylglutaryl-CoA lyase
MADAEEVGAYVQGVAGPEWSALVASPNGARRAIDAGLRMIEYVVSAADGHSQANARRTTDEAVAAVSDVAEVVHGAGGRLEVIIATAWDCPFDGPTPPQRTTSVARRSIDLGADQLCLGDTIGTTSPARAVELIGTVRDAVGDVPLGAHFHNTRGMGIASALAAVQAGVTQLDASVGGLGGCPFAPGASGNIATEELVYMLDDAGVRTGLNADAVLAAATLAQELLGHPLESNLLRAKGRSQPRPPRGDA